MTAENKPTLRPPPPSSAAITDKSSTAKYIAWAFAGVFVTLLAVVFVLPALVSQPGRPPDSQEDKVTAGRTDTRLARAAAEQALQQVLRLQAELKLLNAPAWGGSEWSRVPPMLSRGDRSFAERRFADAQQRYQDAVDVLNALRDSRPDRLQQALNAGQSALADDKVEQAVDAFQQALLIEDDHPLAVEGIARAKVRPQVLAAMAAAAQAETQGDIDQAITSLQTARQLDAGYPPAGQALARLEQLKARTGFEQAMSDALTALQQGKFKTAEQALQRAAQFDPQHPSLNDGRRQLALSRQKAALQRLRSDAREFAREENWDAAIQAYKKALAIDANAGFAQQNLVPAQKRAALHKQFDHYLADPERLYSAEPLANAEQLLDVIDTVPAAQPKLQAKRDRLESLVAAARQPLNVRLRSDGQTQVVVYHVGRLGKFTEQVLQLKPGTYTAVGSRAGYRDIRRVFTLKPGQTEPLVDIRCEEPL